MRDDDGRSNKSVQKFSDVLVLNHGSVVTIVHEACKEQDPILFSASIYATLKKQPVREAQRGRVTTLIGENFSVASIEAEKSFMGLGPGEFFVTFTFH